MIVEALEISGSLWAINLEKWLGLFVFLPDTQTPTHGQAGHETQCQKEILLRVQQEHNLFSLV